MSPTFEVRSSIRHDWKRLTPEQRERFRHARDRMVEALVQREPFDPALRIKGVRGADGVFEMSWAPDGRATFEYGPEIHPGEPHIVWRRIGTHDIFDRP